MPADNFRGLRLANEMGFSAGSHVMRSMYQLKFMAPPAAAVAQAIGAVNQPRSARAKGEVAGISKEKAP